MKRFFFNLRYPGKTIFDPEGSYCTSFLAAKIEARAFMRELAAEPLADDRLFSPVDIDVCSQGGELLARISLTEAVNEIIPLNRMLSAAPGSC